ncbi:porin [Amphritea pacifica]|uniref:Porin n=1 Tax=Amphritea pacifica TaxID=2811233 RepID=A0ABS2W6F5_9GAMM|nr:porin [Amphritea pacifica]MBN0987221.1 porin [Amphritea pacifica]
MKKSIIALAVAGALTAPMVAQADATLYGSLRIKAQKLEGASNDNLNVTDNSSRIGIKGSSELFSGATAFFQFEQAVSTDTGAWAGGRLGNLGVKGDFGTAIFGRIWTPYYSFTGAQTDILDNATSASSAYVVGAHRASDVIAYVSPDMGGLTLAAAILPSDFGPADDETADVRHVAGTYAAAGFTAGLSYLDIPAADLEIKSAALSYTMGDFYVATRYENRDAGAGADSDAYEVAGSYTMGNTTLLANYIDDDVNVDNTVSVEVQQKLGKQARAFAAIIDADIADGGDGFEVGYRVDF